MGGTPGGAPGAGGGRRRPADGPSLLVVGVDGSETAWHALAWACGHARRAGCPILAVYVSALRYWNAPTPVDDSVAALADAEQATAESLRREVEQLAEAFSTTIEFQHRHGDPAQELLAAAREGAADLLAIGSSTHRLHQVAGSLAVRLTRRKQLPVVVIP